MDDNSRTIAGMRDRLEQLRRIAMLSHSPEITELVLKVANDLSAEIRRLEGNALPEVVDLQVPPPAQG
jgi:hypothetical protein